MVVTDTMASVESRLKVIEQVDFKGSFTDAEFESYRNMFMVTWTFPPSSLLLHVHA